MLQPKGNNDFLYVVYGRIDLSVFSTDETSLSGAGQSSLSKNLKRRHETEDTRFLLKHSG